MARALLIANPAAARTEARAVTTVRDTLRRGGWTVEVLRHGSAGDARRFAREAHAQGFDALVSYGGDGTAMEIAAGAVNSGIPLGLVPGGTGNLLAGTCGCHATLRGGARDPGRPHRVDRPRHRRARRRHPLFRRVWRHGFRRPTDGGNSRDGEHRWKMAAYVMQAFAALPHVTSPLHRVTVDGVARELPAAMVLVANCGSWCRRFCGCGTTSRRTTAGSTSWCFGPWAWCRV